MDMLPPEKQSLAQPEMPSGYEQVVSYISQQMIEGTLKAGDRLLPERELAVRLDVSRPILREALRSLAMIGVLEIRQGSGTFVRSPDISNFGHLFTVMISQHASVVEDIMELRVALERQAIRLACARATRQDIAAIEDAFERVIATIDTPEEGGKADYAFHTQIVKASHSNALIKMYDVVSILLQGNHIERRQRIALNARHREFLIDHHEHILNAIKDRNADESERLLSQHFDIGAELA